MTVEGLLIMVLIMPSTVSIIQTANKRHVPQRGHGDKLLTLIMSVVSACSV